MDESQKQENESPGSGCVYFIRSPDGAFMKIGFTRLPVVARFTAICNGLPGLQLVGYLPGSRDTEFWIHAKFRALQENGEWFRCAPELLAFMDAIGLIVPRVRFTRRPAMRKRIIRPVVVQQLEPEEELESPSPQEKNRAAQALSAMRNSKLSPARRQAIGQQAARVRWKSHAIPHPEAVDA